MAKNPKSAQIAPNGRFQNMRSKIKGLFNAIRVARVVLRHLAACLSELFSLDTDDLENALSTSVDLEDASTPYDEEV